MAIPAGMGPIGWIPPIGLMEEGLLGIRDSGEEAIFSGKGGFVLAAWLADRASFKRNLRGLRSLCGGLRNLAQALLSTSSP